MSDGVTHVPLPAPRNGVTSGGFTETQKAELRDAAARARISYQDEMRERAERHTEAERTKERERKRAYRARLNDAKTEERLAEADLVDLLTTDEAQRIVARLRATVNEFSTIGDIDAHIARVATDALSAKRNPRNKYARRTA